MAYEYLNPENYATGGDLPPDLDPATQELLQTIFAKPVEPLRPASVTPFSQQGRGEKAQTIAAALADVARVIQNTNRPRYLAPRPVGFTGQLMDERQAEANAQAEADYRARVGEDQANRARASYELGQRERARSEQSRAAQAALDARDEEAKSLRQLKERAHDLVSTYTPELLDDLLNANDPSKVLKISGAAYHAKDLREQERYAQERQDRNARGMREPKEDTKRDAAIRGVFANIRSTRPEIRTALANPTVNRDELLATARDHFEADLLQANPTPEEEARARQDFEEQIANLIMPPEDQGPSQDAISGGASSSADRTYYAPRTRGGLTLPPR